jgi:ankyrin repeat protein
VVQLLLRHGGALEGRDRHGSTALILATAGGHAETCAALLEAGARREAR